MVAYSAETELVRRITPHYHRADDEARTLIHSALANAGDITVTDTELRVTFAPLSAPHRTAALAALCAELDALAPRFPGTRLRVRYAVAAPPHSPRCVPNSMRSRRASPAHGCASATLSPPRNRTRSPRGRSGGLDSVRSSGAVLQHASACAPPLGTRW